MTAASSGPGAASPTFLSCNAEAACGSRWSCRGALSSSGRANCMEHAGYRELTALRKAPKRSWHPRRAWASSRQGPGARSCSFRPTSRSVSRCRRGQCRRVCCLGPELAWERHKVSELEPRCSKTTMRSSTCRLMAGWTHCRTRHGTQSGTMHAGDPRSSCCSRSSIASKALSYRHRLQRY